MLVFPSQSGVRRVFLAAAAAFLLVAPFPSSAGWRVFFLLVALAAFLVSPLSFATAGFMVFVAGFGSILLTDYSPPARRLALPPVAANVTARRTERFGLAA